MHDSWKYLSKIQRRSKDPRRYIIEKVTGYGKNWPSQRKKTLERDNYTCRKCGHIGRRRANGRWDVSVHHIRKISWFVDIAKKSVDYESANSLNNLITLCEVSGCHKHADGHLKMKGFTPLNR